MPVPINDRHGDLHVTFNGARDKREYGVSHTLVFRALVRERERTLSLNLDFEIRRAIFELQVTTENQVDGHRVEIERLGNTGDEVARPTRILGPFICELSATLNNREHGGTFLA